MCVMMEIMQDALLKLLVGLIGLPTDWMEALEVSLWVVVWQSYLSTESMVILMLLDNHMTQLFGLHLDMLGSLGMSVLQAVTLELYLEGMLYHKQTPALQDVDNMQSHCVQSGHHSGEHCSVAL